MLNCQTSGALYAGVKEESKEAKGGEIKITREQSTVSMAEEHMLVYCMSINL